MIENADHLAGEIGEAQGEVILQHGIVQGAQWEFARRLEIQSRLEFSSPATGCENEFQTGRESFMQTSRFES
jgi:hypothetical protein